MRGIDRLVDSSGMAVVSGGGAELAEKSSRPAWIAVSYAADTAAP